VSATEPYRPSNGTAGEIFRQDWCARCHREAGGRQCKILTATLIYSVDAFAAPPKPVLCAVIARGRAMCR
jgi:hypothetical protein